METEITLQRLNQVHGAMLGRLYIHGHDHAPIFTLEDGWKNNRKNVSCIPAGEYQFGPHGWNPETKLRFKRVWALKDVPGRSGIVIHVGNTHEDTHGCILPGLTLTVHRGVAKVLESARAIEALRKILWNTGGKITIKDLPHA